VTVCVEAFSLSEYILDDFLWLSQSIYDRLFAFHGCFSITYIFTTNVPHRRTEAFITDLHILRFNSEREPSNLVSLSIQRGLSTLGVSIILLSDYLKMTIQSRRTINILPAV
jgi:hypothetical protein